MMPTTYTEAGEKRNAKLLEIFERAATTQHLVLDGAIENPTLAGIEAIEDFLRTEFLAAVQKGLELDSGCKLHKHAAARLYMKGLECIKEDL